MNKAMLIGRLGRDAETKNFDNGVIKCSFTLATSERHTNKECEKVENTEWHNVVVWGKLAEICGKYCKKGDTLYVEGRIRTSQWEDNGVKKSMTTIEASQVEFLSSKSGGEKKNETKKADMPEAGNDGLPF